MKNNCADVVCPVYVMMSAGVDSYLVEMSLVKQGRQRYYLSWEHGQIVLNSTIIRNMEQGRCQTNKWKCFDVRVAATSERQWKNCPKFHHCKKHGTGPLSNKPMEVFWCQGGSNF